jgi:signal peptidase I
LNLQTKLNMRRMVWDWAKSMLGGLLLFLVIRTFAIQTFTIISGSMEGTFLVGDFVVVSKVYGETLPLTHARIPGLRNPRRGDVVVFRSNHDDPPLPLVKRLVGLPGDTLAMRAGTLFVNGAALTEPYTKHVHPAEDSMVDANLLWQRAYLTRATDSNEYYPSRENWGPLVVPTERYFMMGDNRDRSNDSRYWGFVKPNEIIGRAELIYFSKEKGAGIRWSRIGRRIRNSSNR